MSWETVKLADLCTVITKGTTPSNIGAEFTNCGINYIRSEMITNAKYIASNGMLYISNETHEKLKRSQLQKDDILFSMAGVYLGKTAILREEDVPANTNQAVALIRIDPLKCNLEYVYYFLNLPETVTKVNTVSGQAAQPNINLKQIGNIEIRLPSLENQNKIVDILSAYDDLIENNQKQIKLLEEAAQRLYKEWFVDLRFPGYENTPVIDGVPQGWRYLPLGELIEYEIGGGWGEDKPTEKCDLPAFVIRGTDLYDITHGNAKSIPYRFHAKSNLDSRKLQDGDIVFEVSGGSKNEGVARTTLITESLIDFLGGDVICASFCKLIRFKDKSSAKYMYDTFQYLRNSGETVKYDKRSASSIVNYRWKDFLEQQFIFVPTADILTQYNALAEKMQTAIVNKAQIIEQAKQARDRLLPKLMRGELEV